MSLENAKRIVFKVGTSTLTYENGKPNYRKMEELVRVLSDLKNSGKEIILVTSGAISLGCDRMNMDKRPDTVAGKQAAAAVGQSELMFIYDKLFSEYNKIVAQVLMTRDAVEKWNRKGNIVNTFTELLNCGVIPIVNENDTVVTDEILNEENIFGDNDTLSAVVADCISADLLIIITDIDGLYDKNPTLAGAKLIHDVDAITPELYAAAGGAGSKHGTGGMYTKLQAAEIASKAGVDMIVLSGRELHDNLYDLFDGKKVGTYFHARKD